jgi:hypothetical protein
MPEIEEEEPRIPIDLVTRDLLESVNELASDARQSRKFIPDYDPEVESEIKAELQALSIFAESFRELPLQMLPRDIAIRSRKSIEAVRDQFRMMRAGPAALEPQRSSELWYAVSERFKLILDILKEWLPLLTLARTPVGDLSQLRQEFDTLGKDVDELPERINEIVTQAVGEYTKQLEEIKELQAAAKAAVGKIGVDKHTVNFSEVRDEHAKWARCWLIFSAFIVLLTLSTPFWLPGVLSISGDWTQLENLQKIGVKVLFISTLLYIGAQSLKTYRTHRHLEVVNKHRAVSLLTFRTFVDSATDDQVKSAILLEAARTIFAPVSTGYVRGQEDDPDNRLFELAQLLRGK